MNLVSINEFELLPQRDGSDQFYNVFAVVGSDGEDDCALDLVVDHGSEAFCRAVGSFFVSESLDVHEWVRVEDFAVVEVFLADSEVQGAGKRVES